MRGLIATTWPAVLAALVFAVARLAPGVVEHWYSTRVYPWLAAVIGSPARLYHGWVGGRGWPSLSEWLLVAVVGVVLRSGWRAITAEDGARFGALARGAVFWAGNVLLVFVLAWGLNHARRPLVTSLGLVVPVADAARLEAVARGLAQLARQYRSALSEDAVGIVLAPTDYAARAARAWREAGERRAVLAGPAPIVVEPLASPLLVAARVSGIFSPFTGESHVVRGLPTVSRGFVACHELAHRCGFAREDEANALAFLVGVESGDPYLAYSAVALGLGHVLAALGASDPERWLEVGGDIDAGVTRDLAAQRAYWSRERSSFVRVFGRFATATNDAYLRSMGTGDGVASYGRMVDLVLAWWDDAGPESLPR